MATCPKCGTRYASTVRICTHDGTVLHDEPVSDPHVGRLLDGKYRLDAFLSQGGMGAVYKATHVMLDKTVVVKLIKPEFVTNAEIVRRFQREARAASNLNHPNIVAVYDLGQTDDGTLYIAMEYIDGPSLKDVIRKTGAMPVARINAILRQVAAALAEAHNHNIIHRDLKPHNVMLARGQGGQEVAKLLDFGIAKVFEEGSTQLTQTGFAIGTPQYMAPEQAAGKEVTAQSDLYSLGVMLYEMLIGEVPFDAPTTAAILIKQLTEEPQPPSRRKPEVAVSPVLEAVALRCLDKDPAKRFPSAEAFAEALVHVDGESAAAKRPADAPTRVVASPLAEPPATVPSRTATTAMPPAASPPPPTATAPIAAPGTPAGSAPIPTVLVPPVAAPVAPAPVAAAPLAVAAPVTPAPPPVAVAPTNEGTRPTVPGSMPVAVAAPAAASSRTGLWITLGAVAVLVLAVAAVQLGVVPGQNADGTASPAAQSAPAPQASPASADSPSAAATPATQTTARAAARNTPPPVAASPQSSSATAAARAFASPAVAPATNLAASAPATPNAGANARAAAVPAAAPASARSPAAATSAGSTAPRPAQAPAIASTPAVAAAPAAAAQAARSENPSVYFRCEGFPGVCNALRASLLEQLQKHNMQAVREPARAAIVLTGNVEIVQDRVSRDFGTPMQTRTYTVDVSGETRDGTPISMPAPRTFSFDAQFGAARLGENTQLIASDVVEKIRAYWNK